MAETLIIPVTYTVHNIQKDARNEINRGEREELNFKHITDIEHEKELRVYRRRKNLLMPPFNSDQKRDYYAAYSISGEYLCSLGLFEHNNCHRIQGVSISENAPYYAFSWLIYKCLEKAREDGKRGLDLAGSGKWKEKWNPNKEDDGFPTDKKSLFGGRITPLLAKLYWLTNKR